MSYFGWVGHYFEWVKVVSGVVWCIILSGWRWMGHYFGWGGGKWENSLVGWGGWDEWEWVHCLIIPFQNALLRIRMSF